MKIEAIVEKMGMNLVQGKAVEELLVGDSLELVRNGETLGEATVTGVMVGGKMLDQAKAGQVAQCMLRGTAQAAVGDELRKVQA